MRWLPPTPISSTRTPTPSSFLPTLTGASRESGTPTSTGHSPQPSSTDGDSLDREQSQPQLRRRLQVHELRQEVVARLQRDSRQRCRLFDLPGHCPGRARAGRLRFPLHAQSDLRHQPHRQGRIRLRADLRQPGGNRGRNERLLVRHRQSALLQAQRLLEAQLPASNCSRQQRLHRRRRSGRQPQQLLRRRLLRCQRRRQLDAEQERRFGRKCVTTGSTAPAIRSTPATIETSLCSRSVRSCSSDVPIF